MKKETAIISLTIVFTIFITIIIFKFFSPNPTGKVILKINQTSIPSIATLLAFFLLSAIISATIVELGKEEKDINPDIITHPLESYIEENLKKGHTIETLEKALLNEGWEQKDFLLARQNIKAKDPALKILQYVESAINIKKNNLDKALELQMNNKDSANQIIRSMKKKYDFTFSQDLSRKKDKISQVQQDSSLYKA